MWIDEKGMIVRLAEVAPAPPQPTTRPRLAMRPDVPQRFVEIMAEARMVKELAGAAATNGSVTFREIHSLS